MIYVFKRQSDRKATGGEREGQKETPSICSTPQMATTTGLAKDEIRNPELQPVFDVAAQDPNIEATAAASPGAFIIRWMGT